MELICSYGLKPYDLFLWYKWNTVSKGKNIVYFTSMTSMTYTSALNTSEKSNNTIIS
jgi:hypothetical protein